MQLSRKNILILQKSVKGRESGQFNPHWVQVVHSFNPDDWYPSQLFIRSHGKQVEIGSCLTNQEREELAKALKQVMPDILKAA